MGDGVVTGGVKTFWSWLVKIGKSVKFVVDAMADTLAYFKGRGGLVDVQAEGDMKMKTRKMRVTKNQLRLMIKECQMGAGPEVGDAQPAPEMPCPISTAKKLRAAGATGPEILTWVKQLFSALVEADEAPPQAEVEEFSFSGDVEELEPVAAFGVGYEAGQQGLGHE